MHPETLVTRAIGVGSNPRLGVMFSSLIFSNTRNKHSRNFIRTQQHKHEKYNVSFSVKHVNQVCPNCFPQSHLWVNRSSYVSLPPSPEHVRPVRVAALCRPFGVPPRLTAALMSSTLCGWKGFLLCPRHLPSGISRDGRPPNRKLIAQGSPMEEGHPSRVSYVCLYSWHWFHFKICSSFWRIANILVYLSNLNDVKSYRSRITLIFCVSKNSIWFIVVYFLMFPLSSHHSALLFFIFFRWVATASFLPEDVSTNCRSGCHHNQYLYSAIFPPTLSFSFLQRTKIFRM